MGMPRSRLSRRLALLEERLGVRLVQRSTKRFSVTEIGRDYHRPCLAMLVEAEAAEEAIDRGRAAPQGVVRVACPSAVLYFQVGAMIARFLSACPKVEVQLESTNRRVDVIREGFDIAIRVRFPPLEESELVMKVLAEGTQRLVVAPMVLAGIDRPLLPVAARTAALGQGAARLPRQRVCAARCREPIAKRPSNCPAAIECFAVGGLAYLNAITTPSAPMVASRPWRRVSRLIVTPLSFLSQIRPWPARPTAQPSLSWT